MNPFSRLLGHWLACKDASGSCPSSRSVSPTGFERIRLRWHLAACDACTRFDEQIAFLREAMRRYGPERTESGAIGQPCGFCSTGSDASLTGTQPNVANLIRELGLEGKRIAVERNGEIVPRSRYADTPLEDGDRLEIVGAVGGG